MLLAFCLRRENVLEGEIYVYTFILFYGKRAVIKTAAAEKLTSMDLTNLVQDRQVATWRPVYPEIHKETSQ